MLLNVQNSEHGHVFLMNMWIKSILLDTFTDFNTVKYKLMGVENVSLFQGPPVLFSQAIDDFSTC